MCPQDKRQKWKLIAAAVVISFVPFVACSDSDSESETSALSEEQENLLIYLRQQEKFARDVYQQLYDTWQLQIFANIVESEATHMQAVKQLLDKYNIPDPVEDPNDIGTFKDSKLQALYNSLVDTITWFVRPF